MKNFFIVLAMKVLNIVLKLFGKHGGNFLGKIAFDWNPEIFKYFKVNCPVITVTATNGKTMTNNAIGYVFETAGKKVISNKEGNNMETGILSTLLKTCTLTGKIKADYLVFEVDEGYVPVVFKDFRLDTLVILDFFRDQLDRNGEVESLILKINDFLKTYTGNLILNNDDPNVARLGKANPNNENVYYFHVDRYPYATDDMKEAGEGKFCPFCKTRLEYEYYQYSHIGKFVCPDCGYGNNEIYKEAKNINLNEMTFEVDDVLYQIKSNSIYIIYNFTAVISCCSLYNIDTKVYEIVARRTTNKLLDYTAPIYDAASRPTVFVGEAQVFDKDLPDGFGYCRKITKDMLENAKAFLVVNDLEEADYFVDIDVETVLLEGNETPVIIYTLILSDHNGEVLQEWKETIRQVKNDDRTWW